MDPDATREERRVVTVLVADLVGSTALGERLERAGAFLEEKGKGRFIANRLHSAGRYLQEHDTRGLARSIDSAICAHPYRSIAVGLGLGWIVGRFLSRRE